LKTLALSNSADNKIVIEGFLGELTSVNFIENAMLEIHGANGTFRIDLTLADISKIQRSAAQVESNEH
jgi:hypothetical protein